MNIQLKPLKKTVMLLLAAIMLAFAVAIPASAAVSRSYVLWNVDTDEESHASEFIIGNAEFSDPDVNGKYDVVLTLSREYSLPGFSVEYSYLKYNGAPVAQSNTTTQSTFTISGLPNDSSDIPIELYIKVKGPFNITVHEGAYDLEVRF